MSAKPRLLAVSPRFLFPANEGGKIRTSNILRYMRGGAFEIVLASPAPADFTPFADEIAAVSDRFVPWPAAASSRARRAAALFGRVPVAVATDRSAAGSAAIARQLAAGTDLLLVDFPHAAVLVPNGKLPPSVMFTHNVEAEIFARHVMVANPLWRLIWQDQTRKMHRFEGATLRRFDSVIAVSERDAAALRRAYGLPIVEQIDTGVDLDFHRLAPPTTPPADGGTLVFCGAMNWKANIDGIQFLMDEVWPAVVRARPATRFIIVGRNPPQSLIEGARARGLAWQFTGYVDDVRPYVARADVYVIPLRVGSGTRIKAYEAMAAGRPVVSTMIGIEGLAIVPEKHFLAADSAPDFAAAILRLLADAALRRSLTTESRRLLAEKFSWAQVARQFEMACLRVLERRRA